ncbi:adenylyltransferase/cytidyltransferase family protein [Candidatus Woesearchaeota archaeon]|nr:adenylyltransferase/cytidyltransferase family protein [Candidatus Woesearchaeota archaeon]
MKKITIVSGYFNPIHLGHVRYIQDAKSRGDYLIVIVNNDKQQLLKKGKIIMDENERLEIAKELRSADEAILSMDEDPSVCRTLELIRERNPVDDLYFCNGGDRPDMDSIPESKLNINLQFEFGVGGTDKINSSSNINNLKD